MDLDYQIVQRTADESGKYAWNTEFCQDNSKAIVVSYADMEYKFSPQILEKLQQSLQKPHFGYPNIKQSQWKALSDWIHNRYESQVVIDPKTTVLWSNTITITHGVIESLTQVNDEILIMSPIYYFFFSIVNFKNRKVVEVLLQEEENRFFIDFQKLEETLKKSQVKLMIFCSPWNPCGRIWSKEELQKLVHLVLKYKFYIFSDEIYSDSVEPTKNQLEEGKTVKDVFVSLLSFPEVHPYLIYANSYSKAFNSSGQPLAYSVCFEQKVCKKLNYYKMFSGGAPSLTSLHLMEVVYTSHEAHLWKIKTNEYIFNNFNILKKQGQKRFPLLKIYDLQCSFLCLVDFAEYKIAGKDLEQKFSKANIIPTFMQKSYNQKKDRSQVRLNLSCNVEIVYQMIKRIQEMLKDKITQ